MIANDNGSLFARNDRRNSIIHLLFDFVGIMSQKANMHRNVPFIRLNKRYYHSKSRHDSQNVRMVENMAFLII